MICLEMLRRRYQHTDPKIVVTLFLTVGAVILFDKMMKKYAPDMNEKLKNVLAVIIAAAVVLLCVLIIGVGSLK